jgi:hypothetical protein
MIQKFKKKEKNYFVLYVAITKDFTKWSQISSFLKKNQATVCHRHHYCQMMENPPTRLFHHHVIPVLPYLMVIYCVCHFNKVKKNSYFSWDFFRDSFLEDVVFIEYLF